MNVNELLELAQKELNSIEVDEQFTLKDLFKGYIWNRLDQGTRRKLGTSFLIYVESQSNIEIVNTSGNKKIYKKISD